MACSSDLPKEKGAEGRPVNLTQEQENQILKQSFLNLYKKLSLLKRENEELSSKNEKCRQEIERLRCMNRLLLEGEYAQALHDHTTHIC
jgi:predicted RNase H-like nuclease (RuvC/YqgF family)